MREYHGKEAHIGNIGSLKFNCILVVSRATDSITRLTI